MERKNIVALLAQQSINLNKVTCIRISQEQTVFKTKKTKIQRKFYLPGKKIVILTIKLNLISNSPSPDIFQIPIFT
jgi:hypothetical protein